MTGRTIDTPLLYPTPSLPAPTTQAALLPGKAGPSREEKEALSCLRQLLQHGVVWAGRLYK